jgi:hypothetical protein
MDDLLTTAIEAHGGLNAWNQFESLRANVSIGGSLWDQIPHYTVSLYISGI